MVATVKGEQLALRGAWHPEVPRGGSWLLLLLGILLAGGFRGKERSFALVGWALGKPGESERAEDLGGVPGMRGERIVSQR